MPEDTVIVTLALPRGQDFAWFASENVVGLGSHLDEQGRMQALDDLQAYWRRQCMRVVPDPRPAEDPAAALA